MKNAETEGTDLRNSANQPSIGMKNTAETEGTDACMNNLKWRTKYVSLLLFVITLLTSSLAFSSDLKLFTTDNQTYKGIVQHNNEIFFLEGYIEAGTGYFMLNSSLEDRNKATDEGTGGSTATDEDTDGYGLIESGLITVNFGCTHDKSSIASIQSNNHKENITINSIQINGTQQKCNQDIATFDLQ